MSASVSLHPHPATPAPPGETLRVRYRLDSGGIELFYRYCGNPAALRLPERQIPGPADDLWRRTCCEAFVAATDSPSYREFNFSPSGQWATYLFADYRQRADHDLPVALLPIEFERRGDGFALRALIPSALLPAGPLQVGLSAVIEGADGKIHYRALAHGGEQPDFHLRQTFTLTLQRP
ncbi:MAG: DOMON-like domain-containing protein [Azonexus sp.]|nr:DOMON-like domain-containing protein [Azonexus sp.]